MEQTVRFFPIKQHILTGLSYRLQGCQRDIDVWRRILQLRGLVLNPDDDVDSWIRLANLCRKSDRIPLADKALKLLLPDEHPMGSEKVALPEYLNS
jgi:FKBP12-rapamycin complex-associated protein